MEWAAGLTTAAAYAFRGLVLQRIIVGLDRLWDFVLHRSQIVELIYHSDIDFHGARLAMTAIGTLARVGMPGAFARTVA